MILKEILAWIFKMGQEFAKEKELTWEDKSFKDMEEIGHEIGKVFENGFLQAKVEESKDNEGSK